jgi:hypothetical protein
MRRFKSDFFIVLILLNGAAAVAGSEMPAGNDALVLTVSQPVSGRPNQSAPRDAINGAPDQCVIAHGVIACAPLMLTLRNRATEPIRTGLMTCGSLPIYFEVEQQDGSWRAIPHDPNKGWYCLRTFMEWHTIHSGEVYSLPIRIADDYTLDMKSLKADHIVDVRVRWDVYGCAAADPPRPESSVPPPGTDMLLWRAQCVTGVKPSEAYVQLVSNTIKIDPKNR